MPTIFLGIGSNLGERELHFNLAKEALSGTQGVRDLKCSPVYETDPVGSEGGKFWNAVWSFETELGPREILEVLQAIEKNAGRVRTTKNEPRSLDLDILFYSDQIIQSVELTVPHPRIAERAFVLVPFCDLAPHWIHPGLHKTMRHLLKEFKRVNLGIHGVELAAER